MPTTIKLKNSVTTTNAPSSLAQGEVAINVTDKKVWVGNAATTPVQIVGTGAGGGAAAGSNTQVQYNSSGALAGSANLTFNGTTLVANDITDSSLTVNRVVYAGTAGNLVNSANFTFNGTTVTMANDASISGLTVGKGGGIATNSTAVGLQALYNASSTGTENSAFGRQALYSLTSGGSDVAVGNYALYLNTTGNYNTALGYSALQNNTTASNNTAVGYQAGYSNTTGTNNMYVGFQAGSGATGSFSTCVGYQAGQNNTDAVYGNDFFGNSAGRSNTSGGANLAVGGSAFLTNTTGSFNTAIGWASTYRNTTGANNASLGMQSLYNNTTGSQNTAVGRDSLYSNTTASNNTAVGYQAGYSNTTGIRSTLIGTEAGYSANPSSSVGNTLVGWQAGYNSTGNGNTFIGVNGTDAAVGWRMTTGSKNTILGGFSGNQGGLDIRTASNRVVLSDGDGNPYAHWDNTGQPKFTANGGNNQLTLTSNAVAFSSRLQLDCTSGGGAVVAATFNILTCQTGGTGGVNLNSGATAWVAASDERVKENLIPITDAVNKVALLRAVTGNYTWDESKKSRAFLIAQDVLEVFPQAVETKNPDELGLAYTDVIPLLVAAIKELKAEIDLLKGN